MKFVPKRSASKWTSNKMGNAKKGHNKTGRAKVVAPKRDASKHFLLHHVSFHVPLIFVNFFALGHRKCFKLLW